MRTLGKLAMNQKLKIATTAVALFACLSIGAFAADQSPGSASSPKDSLVNGAGLSKNEEIVKSPSASSSTTSQTPKVGDLPIAKAGGQSPPTATQALTQLQPWVGPSFADLEKLRSENAMLAEQLKNAELKSKINAQGGSSHIGGAGAPSVGNDAAVASKTPSAPKVVMIAGAEGSYRANILLPNGQNITASTGSTVPGYGVVSDITPNAVQFGSAKAKRLLPLVTSGANADSVMAP